MNNENLRKKIKELGPWRHNINLDGVETRKISPGTLDLPNNHPIPRWKVIRKFLPNKGEGSVVDLGCNAGGISFELEDAGYEVTGVELNDRPYKQALFVKDVLGSKVDFVQADVTEFLKDSQNFDYSIALGIVYHLKNPIPFLEMVGRKTEKIFIIESSVRDIDGRKWLEDKEVWHFSREWLEEEVKKRTNISKFFSVTKGEKGFPLVGFRLLIVGRF